MGSNTGFARKIKSHRIKADPFDPFDPFDPSDPSDPSDAPRYSPSYYSAILRLISGKVLILN